MLLIVSWLRLSHGALTCRTFLKVPPPRRSFVFAASGQVRVTVSFPCLPLRSPHCCGSYWTRRCSHSNYAANSSSCSHCHENGGPVTRHPIGLWPSLLTLGNQNEFRLLSLTRRLDLTVSTTSSRFRASVPLQRLTQCPWIFFSCGKGSHKK